MQVNYCPACGNRVNDPSARHCQACGETFRPREGWLARLFKGVLFRGSIQPTRRITRHATRGRLDATHVEILNEQKQVYHSLDEVPPHLREQVERMLHGGATADGSTVGGLGSSRYTFRDAEGREHVYDSLEQMPPGVREMFRRLER